MRIIGATLVLVHVGLGLWALVGFAELLLGEVPWTRISNPLFSGSMLLWQWALVLTAAVVFVLGYVTRWRRLFLAMSILYGAMAATCALQTFFILTHPTRFLAMAIEYAEYAAILCFLFFARERRSCSTGNPVVEQ